MIRFFSPEWLWLLALVPVLALWRGRRGAVAAVEYSSGEIMRAVGRVTRSRGGAWLTTLKMLALALLILGMARPQTGSTTVQTQASGIDIMLLLDVSGSMRSLDFKLEGHPASRVDVVKSVVANFIEQRPDDRIGLTIFAGAPYLVSPVTLDHDWLLQNLDRVQIGSIQDGTAIGSGIAAGLNRLRDQTAKSKIIVLLTDGQNNTGKISPLTAAQAARALGIRVYTIGIGVRGEAPFPVTDSFGNQRIVMQKVDVDEGTLQKIAAITGAQFYRATNTEALTRIYTDIDRLEKTTRTVKSYERWQELFSWFLVPGLLLLCVGIVLEQTLWRRVPA
jgi:Ca-activated chloride channel family protein